MALPGRAERWGVWGAISGPPTRTDREMDGFHAGYVAAQHVDRVLGLLERQRGRVHPRDRVAAGLDDVDRAERLVHRHAEHATNRQLLVDHLVHGEVLGGALPLQPGDDDAPRPDGDGHGVIQRLRRVGRGVHDDLGAATHRVAHARHHVVLLDVDRGVGPQLTREGELLRVAAEARDDDLLRAGGARGDDATEAALAGTQDHHAVARPRAGNRAGPREPGRERVEHHRDAGRQRRVHLLHHGVRRQVHALGVAAPEVRRLADVGIAIGAAALGTRARLPAPARLALSAAVARAHGHPIALAHAPARARAAADLFDDAQRLVPRDHRIWRVVLVLRLRTFVLFVVAAADAARLDTQQRVVGADRRPRELTRLQRLRLHEHDGADRLTSRHRPPPPSAR